MATVNNISISPRDFDDLVFKQRNREYGAYELRNSYSKHTIISVLLGVFLVGTVLAIPYISAFIDSLRPKEQVAMTQEVSTTLENPPPIDKEEIPPPPADAPPPPPAAASVAFIAPEISTEDVTEATTTEDVEASNPGTVNQEGVDGFTLPPDGNTGDGDIIGESNEPQIFTIVEKMPEFPGGEKALFDFLGKHLQYPERAKTLGIQGKVYVSFIVDTYGNIKNVEVARGIGGGCDEEAVRVVSMMPRWSPGKQTGRPVNVKFNLPINFSLH